MPLTPGIPGEGAPLQRGDRGQKELHARGGGHDRAALGCQVGRRLKVSLAESPQINDYY